MELKRYQERALERLSEWFHLLEEANGSPDVAWGRLSWDNGMRVSSSRYDSTNRPIPHVCMRVPTGGGKTLLAAESLVRMNRRTGLVLWMVPNTAIYEQTKRAMWTKEHPYRQVLERASGGRVNMLEKDGNFQKADLDHYLCVMLVSLQAANRTNNKEFLKMFRESGRYSSFFPDEDDADAYKALIREHPGLDTAPDGRPLRTLANVFKMCRPTIVLDEAHKSYGRNIDVINEQWVSRFDPSLVLELSATPNSQKSNVLVDIGGLDLKEEEMIKLPIHVTGHGDTPWQQVLMAVEAQLSDLSEKAELLHYNSGRHIRPMALVRVSRTGKNQRDGTRLHAEDVREYLTDSIGVLAQEVRVQSSETKELQGEDLMSPHSQVRWIITKDALKEGWDCSNAYILVLLDNTRANITVTQMMGRVLRQPHARLTEIAELDQCYIHCGDTSVDAAVAHVRAELEQEGFGDLVSHVTSQSRTGEKTRITRRNEHGPEYARLPQVLGRDQKELDYEEHILSELEWSTMTAPDSDDWNELHQVLRTGVSLIDMEGSGLTASMASDSHGASAADNGSSLDLAWYARQLRSIVPNPWQAARLINEAAEGIRGLGHDDAWIHDRRASFLLQLTRHLEKQIDSQAETVFKQKLAAGDITFDMEVPFEFNDWYEVIAPNSKLGLDVQRTLFSPFYGQDMNDLEMRYAGYLDKDETIRWWHRVAARTPGEYRLQGWRKDFIYPDFVALRFNDTVIVHETKGKQFKGSDDTEYKKRLLNCLQQTFNSSGTISLHGKTMSGDFQILFEGEHAELAA